MKLLITLTVFITLSFSASAQNWFEGNPTWNYDASCSVHTGSVGSTKIKWVKDSMINGITMAYFDVEIYRQITGPSTSSYTNHANLFLYEIGEQVWKYNNNDESSTLIYDLSLIKGDTLFSYPLEETRCGDTIYFTIDTVGYTFVNNVELKYQDIKVDFSNEEILNKEIRVIEKIGAVNAYYDLTNIFSNCLLDVCPAPNFTCYKNEELNIRYPENSNCNATSTADTPFRHSKLVLKPNPATDYLEIDGVDDIKEMRLFDVKGMEVKGVKISQNKIDLHVLSGIYFIQVMDRDDQWHIGRFIKM